MFQNPKSILKEGYLSSPEEPPKFSADSEPFPKELLKRVSQRLREHGDREVLINAGLALSNQESDAHGRRFLMLSEVEPRAIEMSKILHHFGVGKTDIVYQSLCNNVDFIFPILGAWLCGAAATMADPNMKEAVLKQQLIDTEPKVIFCHGFNLGVILKTLESLNWLGMTKVVVADPGYDQEDRDNQVYSLESLRKQCHGFEESSEEPLGNEETSIILWSSGTTGIPKGIPHGFKMLSSLESNNFFDYTRCLSSTCFYHFSGLIFQIRALYSGSSIVFFSVEEMEQPNAGEKLLSAVDKFKPDTLMALSHNIMALTMTEPHSGADLSSLTMCFPVGTNLQTDPYEILKTKFPNLEAIGNGYGMTEFGIMTVSKNTQCLGYLSPGVIIKIVDPETGKICVVNEVGEFRGKSPLMCKGYWKRPEETSKLFDEEGFMRFGDLGHYDEDNKIYFDGRLKELIKCKSSTLYPGEIEELLLSHPSVQEAGVFGIPDPMLREMVTAMVVVKKEEKVTSAELVDFVGEKVQDHKRLRGGVVFVDKLPRNKLGKIQRLQMRDMYEEMKKGM